MNRKKDLVSVVITCYNVAPYIQECLTSLNNQTYKNMEVILVNDNPTDNTIDIIEDWKQSNSPKFELVTINLPKNTGFAGALNIGLFLSTGEFIAIHDGDDISHPKRIEKQVNFLKTNPDYDLIGANYNYFVHGESLSTSKKAQWIKYGKDIRKTYWNGGHCVCHGTILFRGAIFDEIGGPTRKLKGAEDYEFIAKCLNANKKIENLRDTLYYYRIHANQRSKQFYEGGKQ